MQNLEWYLADLKSTGKNTIETVEKSLTDMFIRLVRIYPCLYTVSSKYRRFTIFPAKHKTFECWANVIVQMLYKCFVFAGIVLG